MDTVIENIRVYIMLSYVGVVIFNATYMWLQIFN